MLTGCKLRRANTVGKRLGGRFNAIFHVNLIAHLGMMNNVYQGQTEQGIVGIMAGASES